MLGFKVCPNVQIHKAVSVSFKNTHDIRHQHLETLLVAESVEIDSDLLIICKLILRIPIDVSSILEALESAFLSCFPSPFPVFFSSPFLREGGVVLEEGWSSLQRDNNAWMESKRERSVGGFYHEKTDAS
ncbi:hypothetical protein NPIL_407441 [Nephila pilipes]|uniref:Uncharacterized protein n=1 Tax=Nephila pilipes TaxID=299642 RepID=A0A8X6R8E9_NEPPI|nr:hypothetical protein NPIL_407441 [Nephila pilipes]